MDENVKISQAELNAREFEHWQKLYYDEVHRFFVEKNAERGAVAFDSWESRFLSFLEKNYPGKFNEYKKQTKERIQITYSGTMTSQSFKEWRGNVVEPFLEQCILDTRKGYIEKHGEVTSIAFSENQSIIKEKALKVFISHSSLDIGLVKLIVDLIRSSLNLSAKDIRCTSLDGYRLPAGVDIDDQLRDDILSAKTLVGVISKKSFESAYVLFELGARWGQGTNLIPLLVHETNSSVLQGPIKGLNALSCGDEAQLYQFVTDIAKHIGVNPEDPSVYHNKIKAIIDYGVG